MKPEKKNQHVWLLLFLAIVSILPFVLLWGADIITAHLPLPEMPHDVGSFQCPRAPFMEKTPPYPYAVFPQLLLASIFSYFATRILSKSDHETAVHVSIFFFSFLSVFSIYAEASGALESLGKGLFPHGLLSLSAFALSCIALMFVYSWSPLEGKVFYIFLSAVISVLSALLGSWRSSLIPFPTLTNSSYYGLLSFLFFIVLFVFRCRKMENKKWIFASLFLTFVYYIIVYRLTYLIEYFCGVLAP